MAELREITGRHNKIIAGITEVLKAPSADKFIIGGEKFIKDLPEDRIDALFFTDTAKYGEWLKRFADRDIAIYKITEYVMDKICGTSSGQSLLAQVHASVPPMPNKLVLCDRVQDPGNIGTVIRTAAAFGFGCIVSPDSANPYSDKAVRSSAGTVCGCYVKKAPLGSIIKELKDSGYKIFSSELDTSAVSPEKVGHPEKFAVIIGNEGSGVNKILSAEADEKIYIPIQNTDSLNASVAAGILMYCLA